MQADFSIGRNSFLRNLDIHLATIGKNRGYLSRISGVNHNTINALFRHNRWPRLDHAIAISESLGLSVEYLVTGKDDRINMSKAEREILDVIGDLPEEKKREARGALQMWVMIERGRQTN